MSSYTTKRKRKQVSIACTSCRKSKTGCDEARPCSRCVARNRGDKCVDAPKKKVAPVKGQKMSKSSVISAKNAKQQKIVVPPPVRISFPITQEKIEIPGACNCKKESFDPVTNSSSCAPAEMPLTSNLDSVSDFDSLFNLANSFDFQSVLEPDFIASLGDTLTEIPSALAQF